MNDSIIFILTDSEYRILNIMEDNNPQFKYYVENSPLKGRKLVCRKRNCNLIQPRTKALSIYELEKTSQIHHNYILNNNENFPKQELESFLNLNFNKLKNSMKIRSFDQLLLKNNNKISNLNLNINLNLDGSNKEKKSFNAKAKFEDIHNSNALNLKHKINLKKNEETKLNPKNHKIARCINRNNNTIKILNESRKKFLYLKSKNQ